VQVRPAVPGDATAIAAVHTGTWQAAYRGVLPDAFLDGLALDRSLPMWTRALADPAPRSAVLVAEADGAVVGFVHLCPSRDDDADPAVTGEITSIYVRPDAWGSGVGRALLAAAVEALTAAGFRGATLWVLSDNPRARRFYAAAGWAEDGATKDDVVGGAPVTEVRYRRPLC
jgi:GNAT superfamily N-acetyltransferase